MIALNWVYERLQKCKADRKLILIDACRANVALPLPMPTMSAKRNQHQIALLSQIADPLDLPFDVAFERQILGGTGLVPHQRHPSRIESRIDQLIPKRLLIVNGILIET